jgi:phosphoserine phosphatase
MSQPQREKQHKCSLDRRTIFPLLNALTMSPPSEFAPDLIIQNFNAPLRLRDYKLIAFDMDSTLINIECIDEIADAAGRKAEVAAITEAAMRGEITDFKDSLRRRVSLLKGVSIHHMQEVIEQRLKLNPGAQRLLAECQKAGLKTLLVSGGFTFFADHVQKLLNIDWTRANILEVENGILTGRLIDQDWGDICDGEEKRKTLLATCKQMGINPSESIAVGDGANDIPMMQAAGLSVAYHAKPTVRAQAMVAINQGGLDRLLEILQ